MPKSKEIKFGHTKILIFETPLNGNYGMKEFKGKYVKFLNKKECETYQLMEKK